MQRRIFVALSIVTLLWTVIAFFSLNSAEQSGSGLFNAVRLTVIAAAATIFGVCCFLLYRLNNKLYENLKEREETELMMTKLSSAVTNAGASVIITGQDGVIEYVNQKFCLLTGYAYHEVIGQELGLLHPKQPLESSSEITLDPRCLGANWEGDLLCSRKDGSEFWSATTVSAVYSKDGTLTNYVLSGIDITALKDANSKMEHLALYDTLTGLANRRLFVDRLDQAVLHCRRSNKSAAMLFLDLDQFKRINDTLGHDAGDELLITIAERLTSCVRKNDTVSRLGGDEFTILLSDIRDDESVKQVAENILSSLKEPVALGKSEVIISTSIGITIFPEDGLDSETLMKNADLALYRAKENGRDGYHFFTQELNVRALYMMDIEKEIRLALQNNDFSLHYQPQINLKTGEISSVEALIRWDHRIRGNICPSEFISVAEDTGLIVPIGEWVLENACLGIKRLMNETGKAFRVAVNLSPRQFRDSELAQTITKILNDCDLSAEYLELEVTEGMLMNDIESVIENLRSIKSTGATITIDDFGSGYSSLSYLKSLPVDMLKVDQGFVKDIPEDLNAMEIASAVIAVAHKLNLKVIAEGVENIDQKDFLDINCCDYAQGYFFSKPLSESQLLEFFQDQHQDLKTA